MMDYYLSFPSESKAQSELKRCGVVRQWEGGYAANEGYAVDWIGIMERMVPVSPDLPPTVTIITIEGSDGPRQMAKFLPTPYLVNVRAVSASQGIEKFSINPTKPVRAWA